MRITASDLHKYRKNLESGHDTPREFQAAVVDHLLARISDIDKLRLRLQADGGLYWSNWND